MDLPGLSNELIAAVCAANPKTAVVIQSGTAVNLTPWLSTCPALLQAWYGGNETGNAIADILFGDINPSAKLPLSFPLRNEDNPAFLNYRSEKGKAVYGEGVFVGYRYYEKIKREVAFSFGHGLSYTKFEMKDLSVAEKGEDELVIDVAVSNTGSRPGAQVIQVYTAQQNSSVNRPVKELKGFTKVQLQPGETKKATVALSKKYAASFWDEETDAWVMERDRFEVLVGGSSAETGLLKGKYFEVEETRWWNGL
jgi:beta-glucosidase